MKFFFGIVKGYSVTDGNGYKYLDLCLKAGMSESPTEFFKDPQLYLAPYVLLQWDTNEDSP